MAATVSIEGALLTGRHVRRHRRAVLDADVGSFVTRKYDWKRLLDATVANRFSVDKERDVAAFCEAAAVVGKLHPHLMRSGRERFVDVMTVRGDRRIVEICRASRS